jgi:hypothetical protein
MKTNQKAWSAVSVRWLSVAVLAGAVAFGWIAISLQAQAQEHPEEHPSTAPQAKAAVKLEDVALHVESYVKQESKKSKSGVFEMEDKQVGKRLLLTLDLVHRERLSQVGKDIFFVCADFKSTDGKVYDLDFFVGGTNKDNLAVLEDKTSVHKKDGKARYNWEFNARKGHWEQRPVQIKSEEHP